MAKYTNTIEYQLRTTLDKSGLAQLQTQIRQVEGQLKSLQTNELIPKKQAQEAIATINQVQQALNKSFNASFGVMNTKALTGELSKVEGGMNGIYQAFSMAGTKGTQAFTQLYGQTVQVDKGLKQISSTTDKIVNTFGNTVRWGLIASGFATVMNSAHEAIQYVHDLDESLTNIMMVTDYSKESMNEYAKSANEAAKALGNTTVGMTNAALVFAQQGYDLPTSQRLAESSVKLGNVSQQDTATASDEITAYMNAFKIDLKDIDNALSKWAIVANVSAADVQELSVASQKAASTANTVGVNMDQLAAQIAAIETVTREAPENIGNGLKTLYARFSDISMGETLDDGVNLGKVTNTLQKVGVQVLNAEGNMREVGDIMEDLMDVWGNLDLTQRSSVASTLAGKFQLSRFTALMNRSDLYKEYLNASESETGTETIEKMQDIFENSLQGRINKLQATIEGIFTNAFNTDQFYGLVDALTQVVNLFDNLTDAIGGGSIAMAGFVAIASKMFSGSIAQGITNMMVNRQMQNQYNASTKDIELQARNTLKQGGVNTENEGFNAAADQIARVNQYRSSWDLEAEERINAKIEERIQLLRQAEQLEQDIAELMTVAKIMSGEEVETLEQAQMWIAEQREAGTQVVEIEDLRKQGLSDINETLQKQRLIASALANASKGTLNTEIPMQSAIEAINKFNKQLGLTSKEQEKLQKIKEIFKKKLDGETVDVEELTQAWKEYIVILTDANERNQKTFEKNKIDMTDLDDIVDSKKANQSSQDMNVQFFTDEEKTQNVKRMSQSFFELTGSITSCIFAVQTFQNLGNIWSNEDLTAGEKVLETFMNIGMALPMIISGLSGMASGWAAFSKEVKAWTVIQNAANFSQAYNLELTAERAAAEASVTGALVAETVAQKLANTTLGKWLISLGQTIMSLGTKTTATTAATGAVTALTVSEEAEAVAANTATIATKGFVSSLGPLAVGLAVVAAAIGAVIAIVDGFTKEIEKQEEAQKALLQSSNETISQIKQNQENLNNLHSEYLKTGKASNEFKDSLQKQAEALGIVDAQQQIAIGNYKELREEIAKATKAELDYNTSLLQREGQHSLDKISSDSFRTTEASSIIPFVGGKLTDEAAYAAGIGVNGFEKLPFLRAFGEVDSNEAANRILKIDKALEEQTEKAKILTNQLKYLEKGTEEYVNTYNNLQNTQRIQGDLQNILSDENISGWLENWKSRVENEKLAILNDPETIKTLTGVDSIKKALEEGAFGKELTEWYKTQAPKDKDAYIGELITQIANSGLETSLTEELGKAFSAATAKATMWASKHANEYGGNQNAAYEDFSAMLNNNEKYSSASDSLKVKILAELEIDENTTLNDVQNQINEMDTEKLKVQVKLEADVQNWNNILEKLSKDEALGAEELKTVLGEDLVGAFKEVTDAAQEYDDVLTLLNDNSFNFQNNIIQEAAIADLERAKERADSLEESLEKLNKEYEPVIDLDTNDAKEKVNELVDDFEKLENETFALSLDIGGDFLDEADAIVEAIGDINDATGLIQEGFLVAANDAEKLASVFPGILDGATVTAEGMIQLNSDIAQSTIDAATTEMQSARETQKQKLEYVAIYYDNVAAIYEAEAAELLKFASEKVQTTEEANKKIIESDNTANEEQVKGMNELNDKSQELGNNESTDAVNASTNIIQAMYDAADQSQQNYQAMRDCFHDAAKDVIQDSKAMAAAIKAASEGSPEDVEAAEGMLSGDIVSIVREAINRGTSAASNIPQSTPLTYNGITYDIQNGEGNANAVRKAAEDAASAMAARAAADRARAGAIAFDVAAQESQNKIDQAKLGNPSPEKPSTEKASTEKAPKEETEETEKEVEPKYASTDRQEIEQNYDKMDASSLVDTLKEFETYLKKINHEFNALNKSMDRAYGKDRIEKAEQLMGNLREQSEVLKTRVRASKDLIKAIKGEEGASAAARTKMQGLSTLADYGLTDTDGDGIIEGSAKIIAAKMRQAKNLEDRAEAYRQRKNAKLNEFYDSHSLDNRDVTSDEDKAAYERDKQHYENMQKRAKEGYDSRKQAAQEAKAEAEEMNTLIDKYESTMEQIREDEENILDIGYEIQDLQIELYHRALKVLDTMKELNDISEQMAAFFSGFSSEDPFYSLVQSTSNLINVFKDATYNAKEFFDTTIDKLEISKETWKENKEVAQGYNKAIKFFRKEEERFLKEKDKLGNGELAQALSEFRQINFWRNNPTNPANPYLNHETGEIDREQLVQDYRDTYKRLTEAAQSAQKALEDAQKSVMDIYKEMYEQQKKILDKYDDILSSIDRASKRLTLWQGEDAYTGQKELAWERGEAARKAADAGNKVLKNLTEELEKATDYMNKNQDEYIKNARKNYQELQKQADLDPTNEEKQIAAAAAKVRLEKAKQGISEEMEYLQEQIDSTYEYVQDKIDEAAEAYKEAYSYNIKEVQQQLTEQLFGEKDLDLVEQDWARDKEYYKTYKDEVEKTYEIEKLRGKYLDLLDKSLGSSLQTQRKIKNAMQEQVDLLSNQKTMSEYDVKLANARLEILQKQIALEDAQQNKNQMKLRRDSQGNYKYVYAADQDDVREKESELLDAEYNAYEISKQQQYDTKDKSIAIIKDYFQQMYDISQKYYYDEDKLKEELKKLRQDMVRDLKAIGEDYNDAFEGMVISLEWMTETGTNQVVTMAESVLDNLETNTVKTLNKMGLAANESIEHFVQLIGNDSNFQKEIKNSFKNVVNAADEVRYKIDGNGKNTLRTALEESNKTTGRITENAKQGFGDYKTAVNIAKTAVTELKEEQRDLNGLLRAEDDALAAAQSAVERYKVQLDEARTALSSLNKATKEGEGAAKADANEQRSYLTADNSIIQGQKYRLPAGTWISYGRDGREHMDENGNSGFRLEKDEDVYVSVINGGSPYAYTVIKTDGSNKASEGHGELVKRQGIQKWKTGRRDERWHVSEASLRNATRLNTGGYTGEWNTKEGKAAILHEKELVLNKTDTENILNAVNIVRQTTEILKMTSLNKATERNVKRIGSSNLLEPIEQRVSITAEFPNANDAAEIKRALLGLADSAMQYAYREK